MRQEVLLDTGPLVAFLNRRDRFHKWAVAWFGEIEPPMLTCEAVLAEACHLLRRLQGGPPRVVELVHRGVVAAPYRLEDDSAPLAKLLDKYSDLPMSLADACLVRLAESVTGSGPGGSRNWPTAA